MSFRSAHWCLLALGVAIAPLTASAADDAARRQLIEQGHFWDQKNQPRRAIEAWERVLGLDPKNEEALGRLADLYTQVGDRAKAQGYLDRLVALAPGTRATQSVQKSVASGGEKAVSNAALNRARKLAASKDYAGAVAAYQEAFGGAVPDNALGIEYYQTLSATPDGWGKAREGLQTMLLRHPEDAHLNFALAQLETYREQSRRAGIDRLAAIAGAPAVGDNVLGIWRQALIWLQAEPADAPRYSRYLEVAGDDADIKRRRDALQSAEQAQRSAAEGASLRAVYQKIDAGDYASAEALIRTGLRNDARSSDYNGALGVLRLRQGKYAEANDLLTQVLKEHPEQKGRWDEALRSARFWMHVEAGQAARQQGDHAAAVQEFDAAFSRPPASVPDALRVSYADVLIENGNDGLAEPVVKSVLSRDPENPDALRDLLGIYTRAGRADDALALSSKLPPELQGQVDAIRADKLRADAAKARAAGDLSGAQNLLEQALVLAPASPWIRLDLANLYRAQGQTAQAKSLLDGLASSGVTTPDATVARAYAAADAGDWANTLVLLEQLPARARGADAAALQRRAWMNYQVTRAQWCAQHGRYVDAYHIMEQVSAAAGNDPALLPVVATGWSDLGDPARAVGFMRRAISQSSKPQPDLRIQYASLLLATGQDGEFEIVAGDLAQNGDLTPKQREQLDDLIVGYRVKLADQARSGGNLGVAYQQLRDVIARYPNDKRVQMALARLYASAGDYDKSARILESVSAAEPDSDDARLGLIDIRLATGDLDGARQLINAGMKRQPDSERYWRADARLAEAEGRRGDALAAVRRADEIAGRQSGKVVKPPVLAWLDPANPSKEIPAPVSDALAQVGPSAGPLLPRAAAVGFLPEHSQTLGAVDAISVQNPDQNGAPFALRLSQYLGDSRQQGSLNRIKGDMAVRAHLKVVDSFDSRSIGQNETAAEVAGELPDGRLSDADRLEASTSGYWAGGFASRQRQGEAGLSQLNDLELPIEWRSSESRLGQFGVDLTPVYLDAGGLSGPNLLKYGTLALIPSNTAEPVTSNATGVAVGINYKYGPLKADVGTSPLGFEEQRLVGGLKLSSAPGNWRLSLDVSRRAVTDSLLSYAGEKDPLTGVSWGGVSRTGARVDVGYDLGAYGVYANGGFYTLDGHNVDSNTEATLGAGYYQRVMQTDTQSLTVGLNFTGFSYNKNLRYYSFGQGGYFSPKVYTALTLPLSWTGHRTFLSYAVNLSLGLASFREDGNAYYPAFAGLQSQLDTLAAQQPTLNLPLGYSSQNSSGLTYSVSGLAEYRLFPQVAIGGLVSADNARDYRETQLMGYLRYYFVPQFQLLPAPSFVKPFYAQ